MSGPLRIAVHLLLAAGLAAGPGGSLPLLGDGHCPIHGRGATAAGSPGDVEPAGHGAGARHPAATASASDHCSGTATSAASPPPQGETPSSDCCPLCDLACCGTASGPAGLALGPSVASVALATGETLAGRSSALGPGATLHTPQPRGPPLR